MSASSNKFIESLEGRQLLSITFPGGAVPVSPGPGIVVPFVSLPALTGASFTGSFKSDTTANHNQALTLAVTSETRLGVLTITMTATDMVDHSVSLWAGTGTVNAAGAFTMTVYKTHDHGHTTKIVATGTVGAGAKSITGRCVTYAGTTPEGSGRFGVFR